MCRGVLAAWLAVAGAIAQVVPTGGSYGSVRASDTGFSGASNATGAYVASIPLDLPTVRDGIPVPLHIAYGGNAIGAAGLGWDIALSYLYIDDTVARRRPANIPNSIPVAREQRYVMLDGDRIDLVGNATGDGWVARRDAPQLDIRDLGGGTMVMYDGQGRTYVFSAEGSAAGARLAGGNLFLLREIRSAKGNIVHLEYSIASPTVGGAAPSLAINVASIRYNTSPTSSSCFKNTVVLSYDSGTSLFGVTMIGSTPLVRTQKLIKVQTTGVANCGDSPTRLRLYSFNYALDPDTSAPRLSQVTMSGRQGTAEGNSIFPIATYTYGSASATSGKLVYRETQRVPLPSDVGPTSVDASSPNGAPVVFGIAHPPLFLSGEGPLQGQTVPAQDLLDLNGDGRPDLLYDNGNGGGPVVARNLPDSTGKTSLLAEQSRSIGLDLSATNPSEVRDQTVRSLENGNISDSRLWRQFIDVNGDGRLDLVDALEERDLQHWIFYLNTPNPSDPSSIIWQRRPVSVAAVERHLSDAGFGSILANPDFQGGLPLELTTTTHDDAFNFCWEWTANSQWVLSLDGYQNQSSANHCASPQGQDDTLFNVGPASFGSLALPDKTLTQWEFKDVNGDGYPDFVYNASPLTEVTVPAPQPQAAGSFVGQFQETQETLVRDVGSPSDVKVLLNVAGVHLDADGGDTALFAAPTTLESSPLAGGCGVSRWVQDDLLIVEGSPIPVPPIGVKVQACDFADINGDSIADRVTTTSQGIVQAALGTGDLVTPFAPFQITLPGPLGREDPGLAVFNTPTAANENAYQIRPKACPSDPPAFFDGPLPKDLFPSRQTAGLRDINGDRIPDYVQLLGATWYVAFGTGGGFQSSIPIDPSSPFELSLESWACFQDTFTGLMSGLYDMDGDGRPEVVSIDTSDGPASLRVFQLNAAPLPDGTSAPSPPVEGRLLAVDNGYQAINHITYRSAKEDSTTVHSVPFPEVVATEVSVSTPVANVDLPSSDRYAYGTASLLFDPALDEFRFPGYQRSVHLRISTSPEVSPAKGTATITDAYPPIDVGLESDAKTRFTRYLKTGKVSDVTTLAGDVGTDPWALLGTSIDTDARRTGGSHSDWDVRLLPAGASGTEFCSDMPSPYLFDENVDSGQFGPDQCTQNGFIFYSSGFTWRGTPGSSSLEETDALVMATTESTVDDLGRTTLLVGPNDAFDQRNTMCVETDFAGMGKRGDLGRGLQSGVMLNAPQRIATTNCSGTTLAQEVFEYDGSGSGTVTTGFVSAHVTSRIDLDDGVSVDIRDFDAVPDAVGNAKTVVRTRDDGATQTTYNDYDPFGLLVVSKKVQGAGPDGTPLPTLQTVTTPDPITLDITNVKAPSGVQRGANFDGLQRVSQVTTTNSTGAAGALVTMSYVGFRTNESGGRSISRTIFTDAVSSGSGTTPGGRTSTTFLDPLGREIRTEAVLGADYGNQTLITEQYSYDALGRVRFEADPHVNGDPNVYGTNHFYYPDATRSCDVRGPEELTGVNIANGLEGPAANMSVAATERFPTCFDHSFANHVEWKRRFDPDSLSDGPQSGVTRTTFEDSIGRELAVVTYQGDVSVERTTKTYDALGDLIEMDRYQSPISSSGLSFGAGSDPVKTSWHYDSLGQVTELDRENDAPIQKTYDTWGDLTRTEWFDEEPPPNDGGGPAAGDPDGLTDHTAILLYDAYGRVTHREEQVGGQVDPQTINDYSYDSSVQVTPLVTPTHVLGQLAQARWNTGTVSFSYDGLGNVNARVFTDSTAGLSGVEQRTYHSDGTPKAVDLFLPDTGFKVDEHVAYSYDSVGRTRGVSYSDGTTAQSLFAASSVDPLGRVTQAAFGGATFTASYASTGRRMLDDVLVSSVDSAQNVHSREIAYPAPEGLPSSYDSAGRETVRREIRDGADDSPTIASTYDALGQLASVTRSTGAAGASSTLFGYDPLGNVQQQTPTAAAGVAISYQSADNVALPDRDRLCSIGYGGAAPNAACDVSYDAIGNVIEQPTRDGGTRQLSYFVGGLVKEVTDDLGHDAHFQYDAFGQIQRLAIDMAHNASTRDDRHDVHFGEFISQRDESSGGQPAPVFLRSIAVPGGTATRHGNGMSAWTFALGEDRANTFFTNQDGAFVQDVDYQPYGEAAPTGAQPGDRDYTSMQWNGGDALSALGLDQLGARLYDPVVGRFLSRDPILHLGSATRGSPYSFSYNDPVNYSDGTGMDPASSGGGAVTVTVSSEVIFVHDVGPDMPYDSLDATEADNSSLIERHHHYPGPLFAGPTGGGGSGGGFIDWFKNTIIGKVISTAVKMKDVDSKDPDVRTKQQVREDKVKKAQDASDNAKEQPDKPTEAKREIENESPEDLRGQGAGSRSPSSEQVYKQTYVPNAADKKFNENSNKATVIVAGAVVAVAALPAEIAGVIAVKAWQWATQ